MYDENGNEIIVRSYHKDKKPAEPDAGAVALMQTRSGVCSRIKSSKQQVHKRGVIGPYFLFQSIMKNHSTTNIKQPDN